MAAKIFSLTPPIFKTLPLKESSPVIAKLFFTGFFNIKDNIPVVIVTPAEGPSLGVAPSGACICISLFSKFKDIIPK